MNHREALESVHHRRLHAQLDRDDDETSPARQPPRSARSGDSGVTQSRNPPGNTYVFPSETGGS